MTPYRDISDARARRIDRTMFGLAACRSLAELEQQFLAESGKILPADCLCWNDWAPDWSQMLGCRSNEQHDAWLAGNHEVFNHYVAQHPVLAANPISATARQVMRMSDYQSVGEFRENNAFYREVYRHLGFLYQVSYTVASLDDHKVILSWSRGLVDFSDADVQVFHLMGQRLGALSHRVAEVERLERDWQALCGFVNGRLPAGPVEGLRPADTRLLTQLLRKRTPAAIARELGVRRDTVDRRLGSIREQLGLENQRQLLSALAELGATCGPGEIQ